MRDTTITRKITRITPEGRAQVEDILLREERWGLWFNERRVMEFRCLPFDLEQLAVGHLYCRGLIASAEDIGALRLNEGARCIEVEAEASEGVRPEADVSLAPDDVHRLQREFNDHCRLFRETGAAHSVGLADREGMLVYLEDVARHNALDKVVGAMLLDGISPVGKVLVFSGRLASDMLEKAVRSGVRMLIAPGAPSLAAVEMAERADITLMGFVRSDNINIYTHPRRVV